MTLNQILPFLPEDLRKSICSLPEKITDDIEEIRCRCGHRTQLITSHAASGINHEQLPVFKVGQAKEMLQKIGHYSLYTLDEELKRGYITLNGGHRIGLAGRVLTEQSHVLRLRDVTFFNIRIARQKIGTADSIIPFLCERGQWQSSLIIGAPQSGKTTLLRDLARQISEGISEKGIVGKKTGIVDERSEIAGCVAGIPQNRVGPRTDVLDACPKAEGMMMMIRSMSPEVLVVDEIGSREDTEALQEALNAGVAVMATVHGISLEQIQRRPAIAAILESGAFSRFVILSRKKIVNRSGSIIRILDAAGGTVHVQEEKWD